MKKLLLIILLLNFNISFAQNKDVITNNNIIELVELGFKADVIVAKIESSKVAFDTSIKALKILKEKGVDSSILAAMISHSTHIDSAIEAKTGIYYIDGSKEIMLLPNLFSGVKTNTAAAAFSYGIASVKEKSLLSSPTAELKLNPKNLTFKFYFDKFRENQIHVSDWWFRVATAPTEFILVELKSKKKNREIETAKDNAWVGSSKGTDGKSIIPCEIIQDGKGVFIVKPKTQLPKGEYCFYYAGVIPEEKFKNQSVFDFSIQ